MVKYVYRVIAAIALLAIVAPAATLEKMTVEEMAQKATLIVRGKVSSCAGEARPSMIYTRCRVTVSERWKGRGGAQVDIYIPGGTANGLRQIFTGTPNLLDGQEYVLFLWSGRSKINQLIGLSQGVFDLEVDSKGRSVVRREAASAVMLDSSGKRVEDSAVEMRASELRARVEQALAEVQR